MTSSKEAETVLAMAQLTATCRVSGLWYQNGLMVAHRIVGGGPSQAWLL